MALVSSLVEILVSEVEIFELRASSAAKLSKRIDSCQKMGRSKMKNIIFKLRKDILC
jgi:hypothetical protein